LIDQNLIFLQLSQENSSLSSVELAIALETSVSEVRQALRNLGDLVEENGNDEWRVVRNIALERLLSFQERQERNALEQTVVQAFYIAGESLKALRDKRLYRETHATFEAYIRDRFAFTRRAADYLISAASVVKNLKREQIVLKCNILPTNESQCRPMANLPEDAQRKAWSKAVELAGNKVPNARIVKEAVKSLIEVDKKPDRVESSSAKNKELLYKPGTGIDYVVHLDENTFKLLTAYQDKIGTATKNGAIRRLLDAIAE
jgi:intracellular sulfur oxidation DsrE/DsrF family protein